LSKGDKKKKHRVHNKPGLIPTIGVYCIFALIIIMAIGLVLARALFDITALATDTRDEILPSVIDRQRTAINLERLGRFAETVYRSQDSQIRRKYTLAAHILSQDSIFEKDELINRTAMDAFRDITKISKMRDKQKQIDATTSSLLHTFIPGASNADAILKMPQGKKIMDLIFTASTTDSTEILSVTMKEFSAITDKADLSSQVAAAPLKDARTIFSLRKTSLETDYICANLLQQINTSLEKLSDNLSSNAAVIAGDRFTLINQKVDKAMSTGLLAVGTLLLALLVLLFLAHRDIVTPIIRYIHGLDRLGQGEKELDLPAARLRELDDIFKAGKRSATLMTQLADRTEALEKANNALEKEIEERRKAQNELAKSKKHAEDADRAKSDFLAGMSHEIRTPMNTILGMADLMLETNPTSQQRQYIEIFQSSGEMLLSIINDVLDLSKIEAGEIYLEKSFIDLDDLLEGIREIVSRLAVEKGLKFTIDVADDVPKQILGDRAHLRQVLVNLLDNGIKFTDIGEVRLSIYRAQKDKPGSLSFAIADSGIGISEDAQKQIFKRFTQADTSTTRKYGGTGLGLTICKRLVRLMGGTIYLKSKPGFGSTFSFTLDFDLPEEQTAVKMKQPKNVEKLIQILSENPCNILVAEDSESNQALINLYFSKTTCHLDFAVDGKEALEKFKASQYDLILMDIQMPVMDGHEATRLIRAFEKEHGQPQVPIIAVTANAFTEDQRRCLDAGCTDYLAKPISKANLFQCVTKFITDNT